MPMGLITGRLLTELLVEGKPSLPLTGFGQPFPRGCVILEARDST
jgi:hypothetical protein